MARIVMLLILIREFYKVPFNCKLSLKPFQSLLFTSGTYLNLFLLNIVPLILEVNTVDYYMHSRLAMIVGMSGSFGSLLYQRKVNNYRLNFIRGLNALTMVSILMIGSVFLYVYDYEFIYSFYIGQILSVIVGPIHFDYYKNGSGRVLVTGVLFGFIFAVILAVQSVSGLLYAGLVFSSGMVADNLWALYMYRNLDRRSQEI